MSVLNQNEVKELKLPTYENIEISTQTIIVMTNINLVDLRTVGNSFPIFPYIMNRKRRGRKSKKVEDDKNLKIPPYSILSIDLGTEIIGADLKHKEKKEKECFRNSFSLYITTGEYKDDGEPKTINFKICKNGKIAITGCKHEVQAENCMKRFWEYIKDNTTLYKFNKDETEFKATFIHAMRNIDFSLGIKINRELLDQFFNKININSLLETSIGYTGANIKFPIDKNIKDAPLKQLLYKDSSNKIYYVLYGKNILKVFETQNEAKNFMERLKICNTKNEIKAFFPEWHNDIIDLIFFPRSKEIKKIDLSKYEQFNIPITATKEELETIFQKKIDDCKEMDERNVLNEKWESFTKELNQKQKFDVEKFEIYPSKFSLKEISNNEWSTDISYIDYKIYLETMSDRDQFRKNNKTRHITFLVFHSGNVIMSSPIIGDYAKQVYEEFIGIMSRHFREFMEKLDVDF